MKEPAATRRQRHGMEHPIISETTRLRFTSNLGIEDIVEQEFRDRATAAGCQVSNIEQKPFSLDGQLLVESQAPPQQLYEVAFQMRSVFHLMHHRYEFSMIGSELLDTIYQELLHLDIPEMESATAFRVTTQRSGQHLFNSMEVQQVAGAALVERYGTTVDLENYDLNVRVDVFNRLCLVSIQLTDTALDQRKPQAWQPRVTIKTTMAYAMLQLCQLEPQGRLLDPFCGSGTILVEAATLYPELELYGSDRFPGAIAGAKANLEAAGLSERAQIQNLDARTLAEGYPPNYFHGIVTNPPFGIHLGAKLDFFGLFLRLIRGAEIVLQPNCRLVILVGKGKGAFKKVIRRSETFEIDQQRVVETGDIYPHLFVCQRKGD